MVIAVLHAVAIEAGELIKHLSNPVSYKETTSTMTISGGLGKCLVYCVQTGVGKVNAAIAASLVIEKYRPDVVISMGIGGAYPAADLAVGAVAVAQCEIYGDEGVMLDDDFLTLEEIAIPFYKNGAVEFFNTFPLDPKLTGQLYDTVSPLFKQVKTGPFITVSTCTGTKKRADDLTKRFDAICENMEGAAIAHTCAMFGTPAVEIRSISNIAADRDKDKWEITLASQIAGRAVIMFIKSLG
ncbi:MAG: futalosine hydrolase [Nitrospirae bacterium]|nr:futalosine hydrolase [Nitrospirota bacterium]